MPKCSKDHAKCKVTMPKCSKYYAKWQILVPNCCKYKANGTRKENQTKIQNLRKKWSENYSAPDGYGLVHQHCSNNCTCAKFDFTVGWESHPAILIQCATPSEQDAIQQPRDWHGRFPWPEVSLAAAKAAGLLLVWGLAPELSLSGDGDVNPAALIPSSPMAKDAKMMPRWCQKTGGFRQRVVVH